MDLGWKVMLPIALANLFVTGTIVTLGLSPWWATISSVVGVAVVLLLWGQKSAKIVPQAAGALLVVGSLTFALGVL